MSDRKAIVIGCGIGGPVVAMALRRVGFEPVVYEARDRGADHAGAFLTTASNGLAALRVFGLEDAVMRDGFPTPTMVMWNHRGRRLGEVAMGDLREAPSITIKRGLLHRALRDEATRRGIAIELGKPFVDAVSDARGVVARFGDGSEARGALLVGADGIHSRVRDVVDPSAPTPTYTGQLSIGGFARDAGLAPTHGTFHMIYGKRAFFGYTVAATREVYWFANVSEPEPTPRALATTSIAEWKRRLGELFAEDAGPAIALIEATEHDLGAYAIHDMPPVPVWHRDRMVLIGDAIHATSPSSGQGASLAIEDAVVLAKCIRDATEPTHGLRTYEQLRRARVERVVRFSRRVGNTKVAGPVGRRVRDLVMPLALKVFGRSHMHGWLYRYPIDWDAPVAARAA